MTNLLCENPLNLDLIRETHHNNPNSFFLEILNSYLGGIVTIESICECLKNEIRSGFFNTFFILAQREENTELLTNLFKQLYVENNFS